MNATSKNSKAMKTYHAIAQDKITKEITHISSDYITKKEFESDLRANGYSIKSSYTDKAWKKLQAATDVDQYFLENHR